MVAVVIGKRKNYSFFVSHHLVHQPLALFLDFLLVLFAPERTTNSGLRRKKGKMERRGEATMTAKTTSRERGGRKEEEKVTKLQF